MDFYTYSSLSKNGGMSSVVLSHIPAFVKRKNIFKGKVINAKIHVVIYNKSQFEHLLYRNIDKKYKLNSNLCPNFDLSTLKLNFL